MRGGWPELIGTVPQWGAFVTLLLLLASVWIKGIPERLRAAIERRKTAIEAWREIERRVSAELAECQHARDLDAKHRKRLDDENFRLRIVVSMALTEFEKLDPGSQILLKAQAIMALPVVDAEQEDREKRRLAELLARVEPLPKKQRRRR